MPYLSFDPYYGKETARYNDIDNFELEQLVSDVHNAWSDWSSFEIKTRVELLNMLSARLVEEAEYHGKLITSEMGKPVSQSVAEVRKCATLCSFYADNLEEYLRSESRNSSASYSSIQYCPQGIILGIMPWNFPYWQALRFMIPVLSGGNAVILKHASNVPRCAIAIEDLFVKTGFPENLVRNAFISYNQVERLIGCKEIRGVSLTGSNKAGSLIASAAGKNLKKCVLELGGNDPFIVMNDADIEKAAEAAIYGRFQNCGQSCIAAKRLFLQEGIHDRFLELFLEKLSFLRCGNPHEYDTFIGPLVNRKAFDEIRGLVEQAARSGAKILAGGKPFSDEHNIYFPTVIGDVSVQSPLLEEEVFGPVLPVIRFTTTREVIAAANSSRYGLGASLWTNDEKTASEVASVLDTGTVSVNGFVRSDPALPFGGVKDSGYGRELSIEGFREFLNVKTVSYFR
ncbi:MAG: aldehyde dehydrogenase family protein [Bacteroidales bacterium]